LADASRHLRNRLPSGSANPSHTFADLGWIAVSCRDNSIAVGDCQRPAIAYRRIAQLRGVR
jgi:hypothetical protein